MNSALLFVLCEQKDLAQMPFGTSASALMLTLCALQMLVLLLLLIFTLRCTHVW